MKLRHLSTEIVSLIHHVELNESGWWRKAVGQVVKGVLWKAQVPRTAFELHTDLKKELGFPFSDDALQRQLDTLINQGAVTRMPGPNFKLTEKFRDELTLSHKKATSEQEECHRQFILSCVQYCSELDATKVWDEFSKALLSAVQVAGANLFHLLSDGNLERDIDWLTKFLFKFAPNQHEGLRKVMVAFFAPDNHACRHQVLRLLSAHFFAESSQLSPETLSAIESGRKKRTIKVVLDTNFLFSVLQLHNNPGDDAALSLIDLAQKNARHLEIKFFVLPLTLDEAQRVLINQMHMVERIRTTAAMARAALTQPLSSIATKFFDAAAKSPGLTASAFFRPYIDDLRTILRDKGIAVLEAHPSVYTQRQDVVDDVLSQQQFEGHNVQEDKRKSYEALLHDVVLWHAVKDRRPDDADTPFEVEYWAVSVDWRLIGFDRNKRSANASKLPVVLHPSNLVQLLQFWIPRTEELEGSLVDSLQLPLFFQSFDLEDEKATVKVLEAISRYENVGDIPEQTLKVVLANQVLRGRLRDADASNDEVFNLVREELLTHHKEAIEALGQTQSTLTTTVTSLEAERKTREQSEKSLQEANFQLADAKALANEATGRANAAEDRAVAAEASRIAYEQSTSFELNQRDAIALAAKASLVRQRYVIGVVIAPAVVGLLIGWWMPRVLPTLLNAALEPWSLVVGSIPLAVAFIVSPLLTAKHELLQHWWLANVVNYVGKKAILAPLALAIAAIFQGSIWDGLKSQMKWFV